MAIGQKPRESARTEPIAPPRPGADREIELSRIVESTMADRTTRGGAGGATPRASQHSSGASRVYERPGRATHIVLHLGAVLMVATPPLLLLALARAGERGDILGTSQGRAPLVLALHAVVSLCGVLLAGRRLRRSIMPLRAAGYVAGAWLLCLGLGFVVSRLSVTTGDVLFDAGTLTLFVLLLTDSVLRRRPRGES